MTFEKQNEMRETNESYISRHFELHESASTSNEEINRHVVCVSCKTTHGTEPGMSTSKWNGCFNAVNGILPFLTERINLYTSKQTLLHD